ncbi:hypothetical protein [Pseudomonas sp. Leaf58]|uniref:hypothetical protein n=1 Tax=Pseudomonas sp. Leaf58 TaxID=1736226 RepID=UPI0012E96867|nr:hypothetical protein [Pseudomonas sp. Leaf58]
MLANFGFKPYFSLNGAETTSTLGDDVVIHSGEVGVNVQWKGLGAKLNYAKSLKVENAADDSRINLSLNYIF